MILICAVELREMRTPFAVSAWVESTDSVMRSRKSRSYVSTHHSTLAHPPMMTRWPRMPDTMTAWLGAAVTMFMVLDTRACLRRELE